MPNSSFILKNLMHPTMTETSVSTTRITGGGRRKLSATRPEMGGEMTRRSRLAGAEEELAKEMEEGSHHRHPEEEMAINLVVNIDRRVSLMVMHKGLRSLKYFLHWLNVSKNRRDHLLHRSQRLKILTKIFLASVPIYAPI